MPYLLEKGKTPTEKAKRWVSGEEKGSFVSSYRAEERRALARYEREGGPDRVCLTGKRARHARPWRGREEEGFIMKAHSGGGTGTRPKEKKGSR